MRFSQRTGAMMKRWIVGWALVPFVLLLHGPAAAACAPRLQVALADGSQVCLADHAMAELRPWGAQAALKDLVPGSGSYALAMPDRPAACPAVAGFAWSSALPWQVAMSGQTPEQRVDRAMRDCRAALLEAKGPAGCACSLVVLDGQSSLGARDFAERTRMAAAPATAPTAPAVVTAATSAPATSAPVVSAPVTSAPVTSTSSPSAPAATVPTANPPAAPGGPASPVAATAPGGPSAADIAALRQQIESLQVQMSRQSAAPAQPPAAARPAAPRMRARALVVGNGAYGSLGALSNPRNDANAIAEKLRRFGVEVDLVLDAGRGTLVQALADYQTRAAGYDINILFYAGHGLQIGGINYLVPVDLPAAGATVGSVKLNALSLNDVLEYLSAPTRLVFLDACRDNPLSRSLMASRSGASAGLAPVNTTSGTLVAYATKDGSTAEDGGGRNSPYTTALLQHLDAEEDIAVVLRRVRQAVLKATSSRQEPWEYGSLVGDQLVLSRIGR